MADHPAAPTLQLAPSKASTSSRAERDRPENDGVGKFKLNTARTGRHKDRFNTLRERYDQVTAKHEELRRELEIANEKLRKLNAENDLLLDAMQIVAYQQPSLARFLPPSQDQEAPPPMALEYNTTARDEYAQERQVRMNGDSDRQFENTAQHPDYPMHETNGRIP